jgi:hypothetical protein
MVNKEALLGFARIVASRCRAELDARGSSMPAQTHQLLLMLVENAEMFVPAPRTPGHDDRARK